jgi:uracil-DNA glycosylase
MHGGRGEDLADRRLTVAPEFRDRNPRRPHTHGWVAFEVLRRAPGGSLSFEDYSRRLFRPESEIRALAEKVPGQTNAFRDLKHIRCDIYRGAVRVEPPLPRAWFDIQRCSPGTQPWAGMGLESRVEDPKSSQRGQEKAAEPPAQSERPEGPRKHEPSAHKHVRSSLPEDPGDKPKSLGYPVIRARRLRMIEQDHIRPLTELVHRIREAEELANDVPYFDPLDGGVEARCLFLLEAPGPRAVASGFISRNNPDETAKNSFELYREAGIPRAETVLWNIVPWYIGDGTRIRSARTSDLESGCRYLGDLLELLPRLEAVVLVGQKAKKAEPRIRRLRPGLRIFRAPHPSPLFVNTRPGNRDLILEALRDVADYLGPRRGAGR